MGAATILLILLAVIIVVILYRVADVGRGAPGPAVVTVRGPAALSDPRVRAICDDRRRA